MNKAQFVILVAIVAILASFGVVADPILDADIEREASAGFTNLVVGVIIFAVLVLAVINREKIKAWWQKVKTDKGF